MVTIEMDKRLDGGWMYRQGRWMGKCVDGCVGIRGVE